MKAFPKMSSLQKRVAPVDVPKHVFNRQTYNGCTVSWSVVDKMVMISILRKVTVMVSTKSKQLPAEIALYLKNGGWSEFALLTLWKRIFKTS